MLESLGAWGDCTVWANLAEHTSLCAGAYLSLPRDAAPAGWNEAELSVLEPAAGEAAGAGVRLCTSGWQGRMRALRLNCVPQERASSACLVHEWRVSLACCMSWKGTQGAYKGWPTAWDGFDWWHPVKINQYKK